MNKSLEINGLSVSIAGKDVLSNFSLRLSKGEVHAIMGPNGTGKSTLAKALAGHPEYVINSGEVLLDGKNIIGMEPNKIALEGLFMAFQYPSEIHGVSIANFIRAAVQSRLGEDVKFSATEYYKQLYEKMDMLQMDRAFTSRSLNEGFSGGEKKRCEMLQMAMLQPKYAILDETDSGLDIDALKIVSNAVNSMRSPERAFLIITHYQRLLDYIVPDYVHILVDGRIVRSGGPELAKELEQKGYEWLRSVESAA